METLQKWLSDLGQNYTLEELKNLKYLSLDNTKITSLPESFCELKDLKYLYLYNTQLTSLPESFCKLKKLEILSLQNTKITSLPENFCELKNLKYLSLYNTNIFVNKKNKQLIEFLDKYKAPYTLVEDTLLTDILI